MSATICSLQNCLFFIMMFSNYMHRNRAHPFVRWWFGAEPCRTGERVGQGSGQEMHQSRRAPPSKNVQREPEMAKVTSRCPGRAYHQKNTMLYWCKYGMNCLYLKNEKNRFDFILESSSILIITFTKYVLGQKVKVHQLEMIKNQNWISCWKCLPSLADIGFEIGGRSLAVLLRTWQRQPHLFEGHFFQAWEYEKCFVFWGFFSSNGTHE